MRSLLAAMCLGWTGRSQPALQQIANFAISYSGRGYMQVHFFDVGSHLLGVIAMQITSRADGSGVRDSAINSLIVVCNARLDPVQVPALEGMHSCHVHPIMSQLPHVRGANFDADKRVFKVPAQTIVCFVNEPPDRER